MIPVPSPITNRMTVKEETVESSLAPTICHSWEKVPDMNSQEPHQCFQGTFTVIGSHILRYSITYLFYPHGLQSAEYDNVDSELGT